MYLKNDRYVPLCKNCVNEIFDSLSRKYNDNRIATILCCHMLDIPFYHSLYDSININNNTFSMGLYLRQINGKQYQFKNFCNTLLDKELMKSSSQIQQEKEVKWNKDELQNKNDAIKTIGYDPFEGYSEVDRRFLFNELVKYFDDDIADDTYKLSQIIQIVNNNNQIRNYDVLISKLDPIKDAGDIKNLNAMKSNLVGSNDKIAKENEISVKNRSNKEIGKSTLGYLQRKLRELDIPKAEANYYDQLRSEGTQWAIDMSHKSVLANALFDENDKQEIFTKQREKLLKTQQLLDDEIEKTRLLQAELDKLKLPKESGD